MERFSNFWLENNEYTLDSIISLFAQITAHLEDRKHECERVCCCN
jgi:hypothetical protein